MRVILRDSFPDRWHTLLVELERRLPLDESVVTELPPRCTFCHKAESRSDHFVAVGLRGGGLRFQVKRPESMDPALHDAEAVQARMRARPAPPAPPARESGAGAGAERVDPEWLLTVHSIVAYACAGCAANAADAVLGPDPAGPGPARMLADVVRAIDASGRGRTDRVANAVEETFSRTSPWERVERHLCSLCGTSTHAAAHARLAVDVCVCSECATSLRAASALAVAAPSSR